MDGVPADRELLELVRLAVEGRPDALDEIVRRFFPRVRELVHRELQQDFRKRHRWILALFSTMDIAQEVFTDVIRKLQGCEFESEEKFVAYLSTVVRHRLLDAVRFNEAGRRDSRRQVGEPEQGLDGLSEASREPEPAQYAAIREQARVLQEVMESFPPRHRTLLELRMVDEEAFPAIATKLGYSSAETARQAFWDAQAKLLVRLRARGIRGPGSTTG